MSFLSFLIFHLPFHGTLLSVSQPVFCAFVRVPTDNIPATQPLMRDVETIAIWPQAKVC